jgi:hypothetical protein
MTTFTLSKNELKALGRKAGGKSEYNSRGYALIAYGTHLQHHIRLDLQKWPGNNSYSKLNQRNQYEYLVSSFHIKRETFYSREEQDYDYLYFAYAGAGVWQPVWGYNKTERLSSASGMRRDSDDAAWAEGMQVARQFLEDLSDVTRTQQAVATGPVQGARANLAGTL